MQISLMDFFFPKRCVGCKAVGTYLCKACVGQVQAVQTQLCLVCDRPAVGGVTHPVCRGRYTPDGITAIFSFRPPIKQLTHQLKYRGAYTIAATAAELFFPFVPKVLKNTEAIIVPVPLHVKKRRERGFNQSELLAEAIGSLFNLSVQTNLLSRIRETQSQTKLSRNERKRNVANAFLASAAVGGKNIILIDDTVTTGATVSACAKALKQAGANWVWVIAFAQAPNAFNTCIIAQNYS